MSTPTPITLTTPPGTDIWRKPPNTHTFNAPTHPSTLPTHPLSTFQQAKVTFTLPPGPQLRQYDQAGLLLHLTKPGEQDRWLKTGIEFYYGKPYLSTVGCDRWADWSVVPLSSSDSADAEIGATLEARREKDELGTSLWVYRLGLDGEGKEVERRPLREVNWIFAEEEGWSLGVGGYVARPTKEGGDGELRVEFGVLEVKFE